MAPRRRSDGTLIFKDYDEFRPNLTPKEMFMQGAFGGTYFRPIKSGVTGRSYRNVHKRYSFLRSVPEYKLCSTECDLSINKYGVHSGTSLEYWESKGWISAQDPYGWVQWYCEFYRGRRSPDDERQIDRWLKFAGPRGRFLRRIVGMIKRRGTRPSDPTVSPVIRQGLHHWAKKITSYDIK